MRVAGWAAIASVLSLAAACGGPGPAGIDGGAGTGGTVDGLPADLTRDRAPGDGSGADAPGSTDAPPSADGPASADVPASTDAPAEGGTDGGRDGAADGRRDGPPTVPGARAKAIAAGGDTTCAILLDGRVKCWGNNGYGQLGIGDTQARGDDPGEMGAALPAVDLGTGRTAVAVSVGYNHACALLDDAHIKCWGNNDTGKLGLGDAFSRGDNPGEMGDALPEVNLGTGRTVKVVSAAFYHTCAILDDDLLKCWGGEGGAVSRGELGYGDTMARGIIPGQMGDALPAVDFGAGRKVKAVSSASDNNCVVLDNGTVKCWGDNSIGELGLDDLVDRGNMPGQMGANLPVVDLGTGRTAVGLLKSISRTMCALLDNQTLKCWGRNFSGQLGIGDAINRGAAPGEMGDNLPAVDFGTGLHPLSIGAIGNDHTCMLLTGDRLKCWGEGGFGQAGDGVGTEWGDMPGEMGDVLPVVDVGTGRTVVSVAAGLFHTCVLLDDGGVKCFGMARFYGNLGQGDVVDWGNMPGQMGDDLAYVDLGP
jgi:alpha-tubulin suppressor-like RCC1 family protein